MENHNLRNENKKLKALQTVTSSIAYDNERVQQLEKVFRELMSSMEGKIEQILEKKKKIL